MRDPDRALALVDNDPTMLEAADETGNAPIHWAILTRQATLVNGLHRRGANLGHTRFDGQRPIYLVEGDYWFRTDRTDLGDAVEEDANELVRHMLGLDAKYEMCTAIRLGDLDRVRSLMTVKPSLVNDLSNDPQPPSSAGEHGRRRPIVEAARFNRLNIAELLIGEGVDVNLGVPLWAPYGQALFKACSGGHLTMAQMLLQAGARPNVEVESSGDCFSIMEGQEASTIEQLQALLRSFGGVAVAFND